MHLFTATLTNIWCAANVKPFSCSVAWWVCSVSLLRSPALSPFSFFVFPYFHGRTAVTLCTIFAKLARCNRMVSRCERTSFLNKFSHWAQFYAASLFPGRKHKLPAHSKMGWKAQNNSILIYICNLHTTFIVRHAKHRIPHNQKWWWWGDDAATAG